MRRTDRVSTSAASSRHASNSAGHRERPFSETTLQALIYTFATSDEREAILYFDRDGVRTWTYGDVAKAAQSLAAGLVTTAAFQAGTERPGVAICAANRPEWIAACLAVWRAGGVVVPLDTQMSDEAMGHALRDARVQVVFTQSSEVSRLRAQSGEDTQLFLLQGEHEDFRPWTALCQEAGRREAGQEPPQVDLTDIACIFYTSGTTGPPKGVPLTHRNLAFQLGVLDDAEIVSEGDRVLLPLPLHHVYPFVVGMLTPLALRLPLLLPRALIGPQVVEAAREGRATLIIGVPRLYRALLEGLMNRIGLQGPVARMLGRAAVTLSTALRRRLGLRVGKRLLGSLHQRIGPDLRLLVCGGAALKPELAWRLEGLGWTVATGYGLTETAPLLTIVLPGETRFEAAGRPVKGVDIRIDPTAVPEGAEAGGAEVGADRLGEVLARGPNVFSGYRGLPDVSAESFSEDGYFRTGDLGYLDADGYLHLAGRRSTMIVTEGGKNVQPDELEEEYQSEPAIAEIAVFEREDKIVGLIVPDPDAVGGGAERVHDAVREAVERVSRGLPSYKRLADFAVTRESLPRTRLGKPRRHLIADRYEQALQSGDEDAAPERGAIPVHEMSAEDRSLLEDPAARSTWDWLAERFTDRRLTPDSNLRLDLGIDSMEWLNITMEMSSRTGTDLSEDAIARIDTVRDLLEEVTRGGEAGLDRRELLDHPEASLSDDQKLWLQPQNALLRSSGRILYGVSRAVMATAFRLDVRGTEHLPNEGPFVVAPNHASYLDPFVVASALGYRKLRGTYWAGWTGVMFGNPVIRLFSRIAQVVPIDPARAVASSLAFAAVILRRGSALVWFPEGQRSLDGTLQPFKPGLGLLLERYPVPVLPVVIEGSYEALPPHKTLPRPRLLRVIVHPPLDPAALAEEGEAGDTSEKIMAALHRHMATLVRHSTDE